MHQILFSYDLQTNYNQLISLSFPFSSSYKTYDFNILHVEFKKTIKLFGHSVHTIHYAALYSATFDLCH